MRLWTVVAKWMMLGVLLVAVSGCGELYHQPAYRPEDPPRLVPALGAVPQTGVEPAYSGVDPKTLTNPTPNDQASFSRGQRLFNTFCIPCHGLQGKGNGPVASAYVPQPADLTSSRVQGLADGEIFLVVTNGFSTMPQFRKQLQPNERWDIVNYVRSFATNQAGAPAPASSPAPAPAPPPATSPPAAPAPAAPAKAPGDPVAGQQAIMKYGCGGCHTIPGVQGASGTVGPNLAGVSKLPVIVNTSTQMTPDNLAKWIMDPQSIKPGTTMPTLGVNQTDAQNISAYLYTLQ